MPKKGFKFDKALQQLERLVERLSTEELELDDALNLFEEGIKLSLECFKKLEESKSRIEFLVKQSEKAFKRIETSAERLLETGMQVSNELGLEKEENYDSDELVGDNEEDREDLAENGVKSSKSNKSKQPPKLLED